MEHLSIAQSEKYETIIQQIEAERHKFEELDKQNKELNNKIIAAGLALKRHTAPSKIFKVFVKIFNSVFEIFDVFGEKLPRRELESLPTHKSKKFYHVEVHASPQFLEKIAHQHWTVNACVKNSKSRASKSLNVRSNVASPIQLIVPFDGGIEEALVDVDVAWPTVSVWSCLKIASIPIDVSYFFGPYSDPTSDLSKCVVSICRQYNDFPRHVAQLPVAEYKFPCDSSSSDLFQLVFRNCYHKVDPRKYFSKIDDVATVKVSTGNSNMITMRLNEKTKIFSIEATVQELYLLKKCLVKDLKRNTYDIHQNSISNLLSMKNNLEIIGEVENDMLVNIYRELRETIL